MNDEQLIPELKDMRDLNGKDYSISDWINWKGDIQYAIAYSELFWPEFVEHKDCILLKIKFNDNNFATWEKTVYVKHYAQIESVINHIHILDIFPYETVDSINKSQILFIGRKLLQMWRAKLNTEFEDRKFEVNFNDKEELEDLLDYEITFYQPVNLERKTNQV